MKKLLGIVVLSLSLSGNAFSHESKDSFFLECTGNFPLEIRNNFGGVETQLIKINLKKQKIVFEGGYEFIANKKWDVADFDFRIFHGVREDLMHYKKPKLKEHLVIDRFSGESFFWYSGNKVRPEKLTLKCKKIDRKF